MQSFEEKIFYKLIILALSVGLTTPVIAGEVKIDVVKMEAMANEGNVLAQKMTGDMYYHTDLAKSFTWYEKAAKQNDTGSQYTIGFMYENGMGVPQDYHKAVKWYRTAAARYNSRAQNNLGVMYENGTGVRQDYKIAKEWYGKACDNGVQLGCDNYRRLND